jgi:predicted phosphodiesterase
MSSNERKTLVMSDIHFPFENRNALDRALEIGVKERVEQIILLGDVIDFHSISRFKKDPKTRNLKKELQRTRQFFTRLRKLFPKAKIIFMEGNHELRLKHFLWEKAEEFSDLEELTLASLLHFKKYGIIDNIKDTFKIGDLTLCHGHTLKGTLSAYPSRTAYIAAKTSVLFGHCHRVSFYETRDINNKTYKSYSLGCLCQLSAEYAPHSEWTAGCAIIKLMSNNRSKVELLSL